MTEQEQKTFYQSGYVGKSMSVRAQKAYEEGMLSLSQITSSVLKEAGIPYSVDFFRWMVEEKYLVRTEWHHTGPNLRTTDFYDMADILSQLRELDIYYIYPLYLAARKLEKEGFFAVVTLLVDGKVGSNLHAFIRNGWVHFLNRERQPLDAEKIRILQRFTQKPVKLGMPQAVDLLTQAGITDEDLAHYGVKNAPQPGEPLEVADMKGILVELLGEGRSSEARQLFEEWFQPKEAEPKKTEATKAGGDFGYQYLMVRGRNTGTHAPIEAVAHGSYAYLKNNKKIPLSQLELLGPFRPTQEDQKWIGHTKRRISVGS